MLRELEELNNKKVHFININENLQTDYSGLDKKGQEIMKLLENARQAYHRNVDICHMLQMEIREAEIDIRNTKESVDD